MSSPVADRLAALTAQADGLAARLPLLMLQANRLAANVMAGAHGQRRAGPGETFWEYREPVPGESLRQIDWRRSARSDRLFVREREREVPARLQLWADGRASMDWRGGVDGPTKSDRALVIALAIGLALRRAGELVQALGDPRPPPGETGLADALARSGLSPAAGFRPGHTLLVSDGLEPADLWQARARAASSAGSALSVVLVADPAEETFPYRGRIRFESPGVRPAGAAGLVLGRAEAAAERYRAVRADHLAAVEAVLAGSGARVLHHRSDRPPLPVVQALAQDLGALRP